MLDATLRVILCDEEQAEQEDNFEVPPHSFFRELSNHPPFSKKNLLDIPLPFQALPMGVRMTWTLSQLFTRECSLQPPFTSSR
jgi:hypothetical protein